MCLKGFVTVMKKELVRFFSDKRLLFTAVFMPGIMVYLIYTLLGSSMNDSSETQNTAYGINTPPFITELFEMNDIKFIDNAPELEDLLINQLSEREIDLLILFPENFENIYGNDSEQYLPNVEIFYNSSNTSSLNLYQNTIYLLNEYEASLANKFDINNGGRIYDLLEGSSLSSETLSMIMPMLMMVFMFAGCMQIAPESIAGEKERGTIATILVTPIKRTHLAFGKVAALSVLSLAGGISSFIGIMLSLPSIIGEGADYLSLSHYIAILVTMLSVVFMIVSVICVLSAYAKTVKEATAYLTPLMLVVIGISLSGMFFDGGAAESRWLYLVPLLNSSQCFTDIFSQNFSVLMLCVTLGVNVTASVIITLILSKMLGNEKILFSK